MKYTMMTDTTTLFDRLIKFGYTSSALDRMTRQEMVKNIEIETYKKSITKKVLWAYIDYVTRFPDDHEPGDYPVCFDEWYENDYQLQGHEL